MLIKSLYETKVVHQKTGMNSCEMRHSIWYIKTVESNEDKFMLLRKAL